MVIISHGSRDEVLTEYTFRGKIEHSLARLEQALDQEIHDGYRDPDICDSDELCIEIGLRLHWFHYPGFTGTVFEIRYSGKTVVIQTVVVVCGQQVTCGVLVMFRVLDNTDDLKKFGAWLSHFVSNPASVGIALCFDGKLISGGHSIGPVATDLFSLIRRAPSVEVKDRPPPDRVGHAIPWLITISTWRKPCIRARRMRWRNASGELRWQSRE